MSVSASAIFGEQPLMSCDKFDVSSTFLSNTSVEECLMLGVWKTELGAAGSVTHVLIFRKAEFSCMSLEQHFGIDV